MFSLPLLSRRVLTTIALGASLTFFAASCGNDDDVVDPAVETTLISDGGASDPAAVDGGTTVVAETVPVDTVADSTPADSSALRPSDTAGVVEAEGCPPVDGSGAQVKAFAAYPPLCIDTAKSYKAIIETTKGKIVVQLDAAKAPKTVNSFVVLARSHYFDGIVFHRIVPGFVIQGGDPTATGGGGPGYDFEDELPQPGEYKIGSLAMANAGPNTNGSQFFIITGPNGAALPPSYSLFGEVVEGLDVVEAIDKVGAPDPNPPLEKVSMTKVTIEES